MSINVKKHLLIILLGFILGAIIYGYLGYEQIDTLLDFGITRQQINMLKIQSFILGGIMIAGICNGCYICYQFFASRKNPNAKIIALLICLFLFMLCGFFGIIFLLPTVLLNLYQLIFKHRVAYIISLNTQPMIQDTVMKYVDIIDVRSREITEEVDKKLKTKRLQLYCLCFILFLLLNAVSLNIIIQIIVMLCVLIALYIYYLTYQAKTFAPLWNLLQNECDPYRVTMIMDALLGSKAVNAYYGNQLLLNSLQLQDNRSRMQKVLKEHTKICKNGNFRLVMEHAALSDEQRKEEKETYLTKNKELLQLMKKKMKNENDIKLVDNLLLLNEGAIVYEQNDYEMVLKMYEEIQTELRTTQLQKIFIEAKCCLHLQLEDKAKQKLNYIIENGNTTYLVEEARKLLENISNE